MPLQVVDERKNPIREPYVLRLGGWSLARYLREAPDNAIWEFVRGEVLMNSPATAEHQELVGFLYRLLSGYCEEKAWGKVLTGPAAVRLSPEVVREPDVFVLAPDEAAQATGVPLDVLPALVVEVLSPATRTVDLTEKAEDYAQAGIPEYWAVDPERATLAVHRLQEARYAVELVQNETVHSAAVPGFWLSARWLFETPLPRVATCLEGVLSERDAGSR